MPFKIMHHHFLDRYPNSENLQPNENFALEVIRAIEMKHKDIFKNHKVLFFFDRDRFRNGEFGAFIIKDSSENYAQLIDILEKDNINNIIEIRTYQFIILISEYIFDCEDKEEKILTIAHECQHYVQHIVHSSSFEKARKIFRLYKTKGILDNKIYRNLPSEKDAFMEAKKIAYDLCGRPKVDAFLDKKIRALQNKIKTASPSINKEIILELENDISYWHLLSSLDIDNCYNFDEEMDELWKVCEKEINFESRKI